MIGSPWAALPPQAQCFILNPTDQQFPLSKLITFWSLPQNIAFTRDKAAGYAAMRLAADYLKRNMLKVAQALIINAAFVHQCHEKSIEHVKALFESGVTITKEKLPYYCHGLIRANQKDAMISFVQTYLPDLFIDDITDDWKGTSHKRTPIKAGTQITLTLVDNMHMADRHAFSINTSTTLKASFNEYADKRGVSLRSLRFFYAGRPLFLSSAANKTPKEVGMRNEDLIMVHDTSRKPQEPLKKSPSQEMPTSNKNKAKKPSHGRAKCKRRNVHHHVDPTSTLEKYRIEHSKQLTKIHEEAQAHFKQIRQSLNNLVINRSLPKLKQKRCPMPTENPSLPSQDNMPFKDCGKAGKSCYAIQVGEVHNLYKTSKKTASRYISSPKSPTLDLHGCTQEEAVAKLDESLRVWTKAAMQGSYPFVRSASIVCGCGNQILSQTVQEWIRCNGKVSNAPNVRSRRRWGCI